MAFAFKPEQKATLVGHRFFLLFLFLLATLLLYPFAEASHFTYYAFRLIGISAVLISVYAAKIHRTWLIVAIALAIPAIFQRFLLSRADTSPLSAFSNVFSFVFDVIIIVLIFRRVFVGEQPSAETIFGALCVYLLVGFSFAGIYGTIAAFQPSAFYLDVHSNLRVILDRFDFVYYSFGTMTSLGAPGITPVSAPARAVTVVEAILGVLYIAVLIARLMGAYRGGSKL
jgi:Ion channel